MKECPKETMENKFLKIEMMERSLMLAYIDMIHASTCLFGRCDYFSQYEEMYGDVATIMTLTEDFEIEQVEMVQMDLQSKVSEYEANIMKAYEIVLRVGHGKSHGQCWTEPVDWNEHLKKTKSYRHWEPWYRIARQRVKSFNGRDHARDTQDYPRNCSNIAGYSDSVMRHLCARSRCSARYACYDASMNTQTINLFECNAKIVAEIRDYCSAVEDVALMKIVEKPFSELGIGLDDVRVKLAEAMKKEQEERK